MAGRKKDKKAAFEESAALSFGAPPTAPPAQFPFADYAAAKLKPGNEAAAGKFSRPTRTEPPAAAKAALRPAGRSGIAAEAAAAAAEQALNIARKALEAAARAEAEAGGPDAAKAAAAAETAAAQIRAEPAAANVPSWLFGAALSRRNSDIESGGFKAGRPAAPPITKNAAKTAAPAPLNRISVPKAAAAIAPEAAAAAMEAAISPAAAEKPAAPPRPKLHYEGHRQRLRERFLRGGGRDMADYEFLELLLFRSVPRRDTKPLAKALLARFGSLNGVFAANMRHLTEIEGCGEAVAADLKIIGAAAERALYSEVARRNVFQSWDKLIAYCRAAMAFEEREQFRILFLDKKNGLIREEILQTGTVDHTPVYPRDVVKRALDNAASAIILVHNHPSGDPIPSRQDILMTKQLEQLLSGMNIAIHDHLIIGRNGYSSFRELELL